MDWTELLEETGFSELISTIWGTMSKGGQEILELPEEERTNERMVRMMQMIAEEWKNYLELPDAGGMDVEIVKRLDDEPVFSSFYRVDRDLFIPFLTEEELKSYGISLEKLEEMDALRREGELVKPEPYLNEALPIGRKATCSAPYLIHTYSVILRMLEKGRVFEAGTGSGYHLAITANLGFEAYSADIDPELCEFAKGNLEKLDPDILKRVKIEEANCLDPESKFIRENAPYDAVYFTFLYPKEKAETLEKWLDYLKPGGFLLAPLQHSGTTGRLVLFQKALFPLAYRFGAGCFSLGRD